MTAIPTPPRPRAPRCHRHRLYWLASCEDCREERLAMIEAQRAAG